MPYPLHPELLRFVNNIIDERKELTTSDEEFISASIIQASPRYLLPGIDEMDTAMCLPDMLAAYMKTHDRDKGQDILDYMAASCVKFYSNDIEGIMNERYNSSATGQHEIRDERNQQEAMWNRDRF